MNHFKRPFLFVLLLVLAAVCPPGYAAEEGLATHTVLPATADSQVTTYSGDGYEHMTYFCPKVPARNQLVLFLPGTGGKGGDAASGFCTMAARKGFHVITLSYPSDVSMSVFHASTDPDAFAKARSNLIHGREPFEKLDTGVPNSIQGRLRALLKYLVEKHPAEQWEQYLKDKRAVVWSKLVLSGQSQGGGHALFIAKQHAVAKVIMFGSPKDYNIHFNEPAKWYANPSATPLERCFSFVHSEDEGHGCTYQQQLANYRALGLMPKYEVVNVDEASAPYGHSRLLTSKRPAKNPHGAPVGDVVYRPVWKYLLEEPVP